MNFIEVAEGLRENKAYKRKNWNETEYLVRDQYGNICIFDYNDTEKYELDIEHVLATDWEECKKNTWYIVSDYHDYGLVNDKVYTYYELSKKETDEWDNYSNKQVYEEDLKEWTHCMNIEFDPNSNHFSEEEKENIRKLLQHEKDIL